MGSSVTLSGSGFTGASSVAFHGTLASSFTVDSDSQLTAVVPQGATSGPISVTTPGGSATSTSNFTVTPTPPPPPPTTTTTTAYYGGGLAESVNGVLSYLLSDPTLGSASVSVSTTSGAVTATQLYGPYGAMRYTSGILPTDYGFTHQRSDATTGLDDDGARWYDPVAGQFTSADTTLAGGLNRYAYVAGNPETKTDPTGHILRPPTPTIHDYSSRLAYSQWLAQPTHTYYGSVTAFVTGLPQFFLGTDTLRQAFHTLFQDPKASTGDKAKALGVGLLTVGIDALTIATTFVGDPEVGADVRTFDEGLLGAPDVEHVAATTAGEVTGDVTTTMGDACGLSFAASTQVATPHGEQAIASLRVGQQVEAYDPATGKTQPQTIVRVFLNHDIDRLDVTLRMAVAKPSATPGQRALSPARKQRIAALASRSSHAPPAAPTATSATSTTSTSPADETIHTTANHPWLTADRGWVVAGQLRAGEPVRLLDGSTARVVRLQVVPGVGPMWDISLDGTHTFAVGDVQAVVHNCTPVVGDPSAIADNLDGNTYFHYTNKEGYEGIMNDSGATLAKNAQGKVYATQEIQSPAEAEQNLFIGNLKYVGKGDYVIVFQAPEGTNFTPGEQENEFINRGTVRVPMSNILYAGPNPW